MAVTDTTLPQQAAAGSVVSESAPSTPGELEELIGTADHTSLGRLYIGFSLLLLAVALAIRLVIGVDLATDNGIFGSYLAMIDPSATIALVFLGVMPALLGLAMVIVPLQVGSPAIAFPRAAALSLWAWLVGAGIFITSIALDGGVGGGDYDAAVLGNISLAVMMASLALGATCVATTVVTHRPAGMGLARVPLFAWSMLVAAAAGLAEMVTPALPVISPPPLFGVSYTEKVKFSAAWLEELMIHGVPWEPSPPPPGVGVSSSMLGFSFGSPPTASLGVPSSLVALTPRTQYSSPAPGAATV